MEFLVKVSDYLNDTQRLPGWVWPVLCISLSYIFTNLMSSQQHYLGITLFAITVITLVTLEIVKAKKVEKCCSDDAAEKSTEIKADKSTHPKISEGTEVVPSEKKKESVTETVKHAEEQPSISKKWNTPPKPKVIQITPPSANQNQATRFLKELNPATIKEFFPMTHLYADSGASEYYGPYHHQAGGISLNPMTGAPCLQNQNSTKYHNGKKKHSPNNSWEALNSWSHSGYGNAYHNNYKMYADHATVNHNLAQKTPASYTNNEAYNHTGSTITSTQGAESLSYTSDTDHVRRLDYENDDKLGAIAPGLTTGNLGTVTNTTQSATEVQVTESGANAEKTNNYQSYVPPLPSAPPAKRKKIQSQQDVVDDITTLMIRHLPCKLTFQELTETLEEHGFGKDTYDFLYLPQDLINNTNRGYAFINMQQNTYVHKFRQTFSRYQFHKKSSKMAHVVNAHLQGFQSLFEHFHRTVVKKHKNCIYMKESSVEALGRI